nr:EOG090X089S [Eulimnadia texana]
MNRSTTLLRTVASRSFAEFPNVTKNVHVRVQSLHSFAKPELSSLLLVKPAFSQQLRFAARKGTRERKEKKKVKVEEKKEEFVPYQIRKAMMNIPTRSKRVDESTRPEAIDNVYCFSFFKSRVYPFAEAIDCLRESNHPTVYNNPDGIVYADLELDLSLDKKNRYVDSFTRVLLLPHVFSLGSPKRVLAFCKTQDTEEAALGAGATQVGGLDFIKRIQVGETSVNDYDYIVAHSSMANEITPLRGLLKKKYPNPKNGSVGADIGKIVERFAKGIEFSSNKDMHELDYATVEVPIGRLSMPTEHLEANLDVILKDIHQLKTRGTKPMITHCVIKSSPTREKLRIDHEIYVGKPQTQHKNQPVAEEKDEDETEEADEEDEDQKRKASN